MYITVSMDIINIYTEIINCLILCLAPPPKNKFLAPPLVKIWGGFDLTIFKINQIHYKRIEVFTKDLTLNLMLPHVVTY